MKALLDKFSASYPASPTLAFVNAGDYPYFDLPFAAMAHRGGSLEGEDHENTLSAFAKAVAMGYTYLETDVRTTQDGVLIVFHDDDLSRITGTSERVDTVPFTVLREFCIGNAEQIPTVDELFEAFPHSRFNIDIKEPRAIDVLFDSIRRHRAENRVCIASFDSANLHRFRQLSQGRIATAVSPRAVAWTVFTPLIPRLINSTGQAFQVPTHHVIGQRKVRVVTRRLINHAHARDMRVHTWTINDPDEMHQLIELGVDGIVSDRIDLLAEVARERGLWFSP